MSVEIEKWKSKVRGEAMTILKNIQKLLTLLRDGAIDKLSDVGSDTAQHASDLIELVNLQLDDCESAEGKSVLDCVKEQKTIILEVIRTITSLQSSPKDEAQKDKLKSNCKRIVEGIKRLNELIATIKDSEDFTFMSLEACRNKSSTATPTSSTSPQSHAVPPPPPPPPTTTTTNNSDNKNIVESIDNIDNDNNITSEPNVNVVAATTSSLKSVTSTTVTDDINCALVALSEVNEAARSQNQNQLITSARRLSTFSQRLIGYVREQQKMSLADQLRHNLLEVINVAKEVFKNTSDVEKLKLLDKHTQNTTAILKQIGECVALTVSTTSIPLPSKLRGHSVSLGSSTGCNFATTATATTTPHVLGSDDDALRRASVGDIPSKLRDAQMLSQSTHSTEWDTLFEDAISTQKLHSSGTLSSSLPSLGKSTETPVDEFRSASPTPHPANLSHSQLRRKRPGQSQSLDLLDSKQSIRILQQEFSSRDPEDVFQVLEKIGEGATGTVYKALHKETQRVVAIKKMKVGLNNVSNTVKEIKIMKDLKSPYTLKYYGCYRKDDFIWLVMEYCDGGSVQDILDAREDQEVVLTEEQIGAITAQVLQALHYLHSLKKIHRDVKAGNILLNSQGMAKLADFGISAQIVGDEKRTTTIGSSYWMAPETLIGGGYDSRADIWSLGITLLEMAEGIPPLIDEQPHRAVMRIVKDPPPKLRDPQRWSKEFVDFVERCLTKDPEHRPTAAELLNHPFIKNAKPDAIFTLFKGKKEKKKKKDKIDVELEVNLKVYFLDTTQHQTILVPSHVTAEDLIKRCSEAFTLTKPLTDYALYVQSDDNGKIKEKKLDKYELPYSVLKAVLKSRKKANLSSWLSSLRKNSKTKDPDTFDNVRLIMK
jgi:serine/threonine protein kinase